MQISHRRGGADRQGTGVGAEGHGPPALKSGGLGIAKSIATMPAERYGRCWRTSVRLWLIATVLANRRLQPLGHLCVP